MKKKVLVANRSEIACRIFQGARELGLSTVAICAPGDEQARHVTYADEVIHVSGYLNAESVVKAAVESKSDFVHPGYGFLSERPHFAKAVEKAGLIFVGPRPETMELMGEKIAAKEIAEKVGVPTLPWARIPKGGDLEAAAKKVGFPLLLKASAGGGGKGMRLVQKNEELIEAAEGASREAMAAFGDGTLFLERFVEKPRHIEVQVFGDGKGGGVHLFERECSLQRRHQKVWEEAPAPHLLDKTKNGLFTAALNLVRETKYRSAGTLEFLVDSKGEFFFLEMNTRLQVEHPVSEEITSQDLVRAQLLQAMGETELFSKNYSVSGHAIEVRVYAEDPFQGYIPTPGRIEKLRWPTGAGIRIESGIEEGQELGTNFDSMLAKIIVKAPNREHALKRMQFALQETAILGLGSNLNFLQMLAEHPQVVSGRVHTGFLDKEFEMNAPTPSEKDFSLLAELNHGGLLSNQGNQNSGSKKMVFASPWFGSSK